MSTVTEQHIQQYRKEGYCHVEGLIPAELMANAWARVREIVDHPPDWKTGRFQVLNPEIYRATSGDPVPKGIQRPGLEEEVFATVAEHGNMANAMAGVLGGDVELFTDQIGVKHGWIDTEQGGCSYFHQDSWYWKIDPELGCNCWIPMQEVGKNAIALSVMPRSHIGWALVPHESYYDDPPMYRKTSVNGDETHEPFKRHRIPLNQIDYSDEVLVKMKPGDGLFFSNYTWHRSEPNRTGNTMAFYAIAYQLKDRTSKS